jgi:ribosomal protein S18 acetylase RimI-like enzyme
MTGNTEATRIQIERLEGPEQVHLCAQLMANSEPWITLRRTYDDSVQILKDPAREVYVAFAGGELVGFIILQMRGAFVGYIQTVAVRPEWRGRGIGTRLMAFAEDRIFREVPNSFICVSSFNEGAQKLYQNLGYHVVGELKDYIIRGHAEILMRKTVAPLTEFNRGR